MCYCTKGGGQIWIGLSLVLNLVWRCLYRGFKRKGARLLGHNIITVPNLLYGLKRRSGTFGSILDLKEGLVQ